MPWKKLLKGVKWENRTVTKRIQNDRPRKVSKRIQNDWPPAAKSYNELPPAAKSYNESKLCSCRALYNDARTKTWLTDCILAMAHRRLLGRDGRRANGATAEAIMQPWEFPAITLWLHGIQPSRISATSDAPIHRNFARFTYGSMKMDGSMSYIQKKFRCT